MTALHILSYAGSHLGICKKMGLSIFFCCNCGSLVVQMLLLKLPLSNVSYHIYVGLSTRATNIFASILPTNSEDMISESSGTVDKNTHSSISLH